MKKLFFILVGFSVLSFLVGYGSNVFAQADVNPEAITPPIQQSAEKTSQQLFKSNALCTKVGNAEGDSPCLSLSQSGTRIQAPIVTGDLRQAIIDQFGITMNGFSQTQLQWAWEKFWDVSGTNFNSLTRGTIVTAGAGTSSQQTGCKNIEVGIAFNDPTLFKIILTHELGHIIYWCNSDAASRRSEHQNTFNQEGGVTGYGATGCLGTPAHTEDYAEMIAYYLNQGVVEQTARCANRGQVPFAEGRNPLHFNLVLNILGIY